MKEKKDNKEYRSALLWNLFFNLAFLFFPLFCLSQDKPMGEWDFTVLKEGMTWFIGVMLYSKLITLLELHDKRIERLEPIEKEVPTVPINPLVNNITKDDIKMRLKYTQDNIRRMEAAGGATADELRELWSQLMDTIEEDFNPDSEYLSRYKK